DGRGEVRIGRRGQGEVAFIDLRVSRLLERTQHQEGEHAFFRLAGDLLHQLLVHTWRYVHFLWEFDGRGAAAGAIVRAPVTFRLHPLDGQRSYAERIAEAGRDGFKLVDALGVRLLMDAVEAGHALFEVSSHGLISGEHKLFDQAVGPVAL